jgi:hypothetical protein
MKPTAYVETTVVSYLVAKRSRDVVTAGHQAATAEWWERRRGDYTLFVSTEVLRESAQGDPGYAAKRITALSGIPVLSPAKGVEELAQALIQRKVMPAKAASDALHLAYASHYRLQFLVTWNFRHIANGATMSMARDIIALAGYPMPVICTPEQL